jgi:hypothetical protein
LGPVCRPNLGLYLTTLTFIEDGNKDAAGPVGLINLSKRRKVSDLLDDVARLQREPYALVPLPAYQACLAQLPTLSEDERYALAVRRWEDFRASGAAADADTLSASLGDDAGSAATGDDSHPHDESDA